MPNVFCLMSGSDTAGWGYRLARAFEAHGGDWRLDTMAASGNYIDYPIDLPWDRVKMEELYDSADVVLLSHLLFGHENYDAGQGKPTVLLLHGLKNGPADHFTAAVQQAVALGIVPVCSTFDMQIWSNGAARWVPTPYDLDWLRAIRKRHYWPANGGVRPNGAPLRIVHAPTNREIKGTDLLTEAVVAARRDGANIELVLSEHRTWAQTLTLIATADLAFDQPILGYGSFAVECWGMGLPVIVGVVADEVRDGMRDYWGVLPFFHVEPTVASIRDALMQLEDPIGREIYTNLGTRHVERYHEASRVVERLKPIFASAGPSAPGGSSRRVTAVGGGSIPVPPRERIGPVRCHMLRERTRVR